MLRGRAGYIMGGFVPYFIFNWLLVSGEASPVGARRRAGWFEAGAAVMDGPALTWNSLIRYLSSESFPRPTHNSPALSFYPLRFFSLRHFTLWQNFSSSAVSPPAPSSTASDSAFGFVIFPFLLPSSFLSLDQILSLEQSCGEPPRGQYLF